LQFKRLPLAFAFSHLSAVICSDWFWSSSLILLFFHGFTLPSSRHEPILRCGKSINEQFSGHTGPIASFSSKSIQPAEARMHGYPITQFGVDHLDKVALPMPKIAPGMVLIRVHAVSLNYRDLMMVKGVYNPKMALPRIPCSDGAGEVIAVGEDVVRVRVGDRVCGIFMQRWLDGPLTAERSKEALGGDVDGMLAEYALLDQDGVVRFPEHLSYDESATLPCAGVTAWNALQHAGETACPVLPGDTVVIQGTGGVSIFAVQFAKLLGATVIGTSSSDEKLGRAHNLGLDAGCNYKDRPEWSKWVAEVTQGHGADRIIVVGGAGTFSQYYASKAAPCPRPRLRL
jgi:NADPH:quinone reductase-like Zn-dependent oxidoreductase